MDPPLPYDLASKTQNSTTATNSLTLLRVERTLSLELGFVMLNLYLKSHLS